MQHADGPSGRAGTHKLNDGWLTVERSVHRGIDRSETEQYRTFPGGWLEVGKHDWSQPVETVWTTTRRCYLRSLSVAGHQTSVVTNLNTGQRAQLESTGRIFLVPPGQTIHCQSKKGAGALDALHAGSEPGRVIPRHDADVGLGQRPAHRRLIRERLYAARPLPTLQDRNPNTRP